MKAARLIRLIDRFWSKVDKSGGEDACWHWTGGHNQQGYGYFRVGKRMERAHRVSFVLEHGGITPGLYVLHSCDIRGCCNPKHLSEGTQSENNRQAWERYRKPVRELTLLTLAMAA